MYPLISCFPLPPFLDYPAILCSAIRHTHKKRERLHFPQLGTFFFLAIFLLIVFIIDILFFFLQCKKAAEGRKKKLNRIGTVANCLSLFWNEITKMSKNFMVHTCHVSHWGFGLTWEECREERDNRKMKRVFRQRLEGKSEGRIGRIK